MDPFTRPRLILSKRAVHFTMPFAGKKQDIRVLALALIRDGNRLFLSQGCDPATGRTFWRPLGGGINFGAHSAPALEREIREEINQSIEILSAPILFQNVFTYDETSGHDIILMHEARFTDPAMLAAAPFAFTEPGPNGRTHCVQWVTIDELRAGPDPLFPDGLLKYIESH